MGNRNKEDEKMERAIRSLMKLPDNRRCINCNNLGPQYICTTFATFVCMNCSGIHREFTHRVKSISVSKFTAEEVTALQAGGNERARQMYFKLWDLQRHSFPDTSNLNRLRDFIKSVYVDRRYTGESSNPGPSRLPLKVDSHRIRGGSYDEESYEKSFAARYAKNDPRNPPSLSAVIPWTGSQRRNPVRFEVVDDRVRAEGLGSRRRSQGDPMPRNILPKSNPNMQISGLPTVRPLEEILGRSIQALRVSKISNERSQENTECSTMNKEPPKPAENKVEITQSLIDFEAEAEPSNNKALCEETQSPNVISLESLLFDLSVPSENTRDVLPAATLLSIEDDGVRGEPNQPANNDLKQTSGVTSKSSLMSLADENGVSLEQTSLVRAQNNEVSHVNFVPISATLVQADVGSPSVLPEETKSRSRMELPLDLFTANYSSMATPPVSGWQTAPARGMGFNYYPHTMPVPAFPNQAKSINPFDISDERSQFPSMGSLHGVLPNSSGIGTYSSQPPYLMPQQSYYPGSYMGQGVHNNIQPASREQNDTAAIYSEHANLNSSMGKNPFG